MTNHFATWQATRQYRHDLPAFLGTDPECMEPTGYVYDSGYIEIRATPSDGLGAYDGDAFGIAFSRCGYDQTIAPSEAEEIIHATAKTYQLRKPLAAPVGTPFGV